MPENLVFSKERYVSSAFIDSSLRMGVAQSALMIQDNLTECFQALGCDGVVYRERFNAFWVFTKMRISFARRPAWRERVSARTFPVDNRGFKTHVNTLIEDMDGKAVIRANQEACVLDRETRRPLRIAALDYPREHFPPPVFDEPFERFPAGFSEGDFRFEQTVRSQHIDMSGHMNNIEYVKLALCVFSDEFLRRHEIQTLEAHFLGESREGQSLRVFSRQDGGGCLIQIAEGGRAVFEMKAVFG